MAPRPQVISGDGFPPTIGPYSPAVRAGDLLFVSGQGGIDPASGEPAGESFGEQARQVFRNLDAVLRAGGSDPSLVVNTTVLLADVSSFAELNAVPLEDATDQVETRLLWRGEDPSSIVDAFREVAEATFPGPKGRFSASEH